MLYDVFQFDYAGYQRSIQSVIEAIDSGDYEPLYRRAKLTVDRITGKWILEERGTMLEPVEPEKNPGNSEIGYWLLVLLSSFLRRNIPVLTKPAPLIHGLRLIGWRPAEIDLLTYGESTATLIKSKLYKPLDHLLRESDPYWHWIQPTQANRSGWLSLGRVEQLKEHLTGSEAALNKIESTFLTASQYELTQENLHEAYTTALVMFESTIEAKEGLYIIFS